MTDKVLEQRVNRLDRKLDQAIEQDHERLTRLEDVLASFINSTQNGFAKLRQQLADSQQHNDAEFAKFQQQMADSQKRNDAGFAKLRQEVGNLSHRLGTLVEDLVAPSLARILSEVVSCPADTEVILNTRIRRRHPTQAGKMLEIDAIAECADYVLFNETKTQLTPEKVKDFLDKLTQVRDFFPEYQHRTILGAVSSLRVEASLVEYASRQGLLVLGGGEELMALQNTPGFTWRTF
jgi:hypothetical protein